MMLFGGRAMAETRTFTLARRIIFYPLSALSLALQGVFLFGHAITWWDYGPSVSRVIDVHLGLTIANLITGSVLLGVGWRAWLSWTLIFQILLCLLSASAAIEHANIWLATDNEHVAEWEKHPQWVGYAFYGLATVVGALLVTTLVVRKRNVPATG